MSSRLTLAALSWTAVLTLAGPPAAVAQSPLTAPDDSAAIAAAEAEGLAYPRDSEVAPIPPRMLHHPPVLEEAIGPAPTLIGTPARECVQVPNAERTIVRSGEFVIGGRLDRLVHGGWIKIWWKPLNSTMEMELVVRARLLGGTPTGAMTTDIGAPTAPRHSETLEPYVEEAFFPSGVQFPSAGTWLVTAAADRNWGCFLFDVR